MLETYNYLPSEISDTIRHINRADLILAVVGAFIAGTAMFVTILAGFWMIQNVSPIPFQEVIIGCTILGFIIGMVIGASIITIRMNRKFRENL